MGEIKSNNASLIGSWYQLRKHIESGTAWLSLIAPYYVNEVFRRINSGQLTTCCDEEKDDQLIIWATK